MIFIKLVKYATSSQSILASISPQLDKLCINEDGLVKRLLFLEASVQPRWIQMYEAQTSAR